MAFFEFVYTVVLRPRPLKAIANTAIRAILPPTVRCGPVRVVLNPRDPVISGALMLGVYERTELAFIRKAIQPGMTVLDIGANVGLYSALCGKAVGTSGKVIAFEPDPESVQYLEKTIRANSLSNVQVVPKAASSLKGVTRLYTSSSNRGDSRLYNHELSDGSVEIETVRLDEFLPSIQVETIDFIKIDVQGFEGHVLGGLQETVRRSPRVVMMSEFWPDGLRRANTDPLQLLQELEQWGLGLYEMEVGGAVKPIPDKEAFIARLRGREYTNVVASKTAQR